MTHELPRTNEEELLSLAAAGMPASREGDALSLARIRGELTEGFAALSGVERGVSVFGSARTAAEDPDYRLARGVAHLLGRAGFAIITGGGPGIMEAANRGARDVAALSVGLPIETASGENVNDYLDLQIHFRYSFIRKVMFVRYAVAYVIFPGGFGTLDELFELVTLIQTNKIASPPVVLVRRSYWEPLLVWLRETVHSQGKISAADLDLLAFADDEREVCERVLGAAGRS